jgi:hypothetical protein
MAKINEKNLSCFRNAFSFLIDDFNFREETLEIDNWGLRLVFCNSTTGVRISYEPSEDSIFVVLIRLVDGKLPDYPVFIDEDTVLNYFDLQDLLSVRIPCFKENNFELGEKTNSEIENSIKQIAKNLRTKAEDILKGDFSIFSELERIVKKRARQLNGS